MLERGAEPNAISVLNETVLSIAVREGTMKVVKKLLGLGKMDTSRGDLLHCCVQREESEDTTELIDRLVAEGAQVGAYEFDNDIAARFRYGYPLRTPLHIACKMGNILAAKALLRHGADVNQPKKQCNNLVPPTPLQLTVDKLDLRALLLSPGLEQYPASSPFGPLSA
jgi:ankyrin repeat protein